VVSKQGLVNFISDILRKGSKNKERISVNKIKAEEFYNQKAHNLRLQKHITQ